jgi:hypothetical protein
MPPASDPPAGAPGPEPSGDSFPPTFGSPRPFRAAPPAAGSSPETPGEGGDDAQTATWQAFPGDGHPGQAAGPEFGAHGYGGAQGYGAPQGFGEQRGYGGPQQGYSAPQAYGAQQGYGGPESSGGQQRYTGPGGFNGNAGDGFPWQSQDHQQAGGGFFGQAPDSYQGPGRAAAGHPGQPSGGYQGPGHPAGAPGQFPGGMPGQPGYPGPAPGGYPGQFPGYPEAQAGAYAAPKPAKDGNTFATASLFTWIVPVAGLVFGVLGFMKSRQDGVGKIRSLIGIGLSVMVAVGAIVLVPSLVKASDPGCQSFKGTALTAYNQTISDLNSQASQSTLTTDMTAAISDIAAAAGQAKSATVRTALDGLLTRLTIVRRDVLKGSVPLKTVQALNNAAGTADSACGTI